MDKNAKYVLIGSILIILSSLTAVIYPTFLLEAQNPQIPYCTVAHLNSLGSFIPLFIDALIAILMVGLSFAISNSKDISRAKRFTRMVLLLLVVVLISTIFYYLDTYQSNQQWLSGMAGCNLTFAPTPSLTIAVVLFLVGIGLSMFGSYKVLKRNAKNKP